MKKLFLILLFLNSICGLYSQNNNLKQVRIDYNSVSKDSLTCAKLFESTRNLVSSDNTFKCYKGAIEACMANFIKNKEKKLKLFKEGKTQIDESINADNNNVELLFLRFTIQSNCPKVLGYNGQIESDKKIILSGLESLKEQALKERIQNFLLHSKSLTDAEKQQLKN